MNQDAQGVIESAFDQYLQSQDQRIIDLLVIYFKKVNNQEQVQRLIGHTTNEEMSSFVEEKDPFEVLKQKYLAGETIKETGKLEDKSQYNDAKFLVSHNLKSLIENGYLVPLDDEIRHRYLALSYICKNQEFLKQWRE